MSIKHYIVAAAIAISPIESQASDTFYPEILSPSDARILTLCGEFKNKTEIVLKGEEVCEYSTDNGLSWLKLGGGASILAIIGVGAIFRSRKKRKQTDTTGAELATGSTNIIPKDTSRLLDLSTQAEASILDAIHADTENLTLYIELLKLYYNSSNPAKFANIFESQINDHFKGTISEDDIITIKKMGRAIDPSNLLYADDISKEESPSEHIGVDILEINTDVPPFDTPLDKPEQDFSNGNDLMPSVYTIPRGKIEPTKAVVKANDIGIAYNRAVVFQLNKYGFTINKSEDNKTAIIVNNNGNSLTYTPTDDIKKVGENEYHIQNATGLNITFVDKIPTLQVVLKETSFEIKIIVT